MCVQTKSKLAHWLPLTEFISIVYWREYLKYYFNTKWYSGLLVLTSHMKCILPVCNDNRIYVSAIYLPYNKNAVIGEIEI